jgi:hypothetical protein
LRHGLAQTAKRAFAAGRLLPGGAGMIFASQIGADRGVLAEGEDTSTRLGWHGSRGA